MTYMGRPLSGDEKRVILAILDADFDGVDTLRQQVGEAFAIRHWIEGLPSIDVMVGETVWRHPVEWRHRSQGA